MKSLPESTAWAVATLAIYAGSRWLSGRHPRWWTSPLLITWSLCGLLILAVQASYQEYLGGTRWLMLLLGPATVAFAIPIHRHRDMILRYRGILALGVITGSVLAAGSSWLMARWFHFSPQVQASLIPRSVTTPLAMAVSSSLGGVPDLTAAFTAITGLFGAAVGEVLLARMPIRSRIARGASFGMGAHGAGVAKARELGTEEGVVASLIMILAGLLNVIVASCVGMR